MNYINSDLYIFFDYKYRFLKYAQRGSNTASMEVFCCSCGCKPLSERLQCLSKIGRYTGLEPVTVFCRWYPSSTCDPNRPGVEGFYLLTSLPCCPAGLRSVMDPCPFQEGSHKVIQHCLVAVHKQWQAFDAHADILQDWERWKLECAPQPVGAQIVCIYCGR
jgi:hypothetical protein